MSSVSLFYVSYIAYLSSILTAHYYSGVVEFVIRELVEVGGFYRQVDSPYLSTLDIGDELEFVGRRTVLSHARTYVIINYSIDIVSTNQRQTGDLFRNRGEEARDHHSIPINGLELLAVGISIRAAVI